MSKQVLKLANPPIVEAVVDIDCDMPPNHDLTALEERVRDQFQEKYPNFRQRMIRRHKIEMKGDEPSELSFHGGIEALQSLQEDEKQLVQIRRQGFSFNRLAPYSSLDSYLPEIKRTWRLFLELASPVQVRVIRLRYINRLLLPGSGGQVELEHYLKIGPRLPDEEKLTFVGFLNQHNAMEKETGNEVSIVLTSQEAEQDSLPIIFDITAAKVETAEPEDWPLIASRIESLRKLKNRIFWDTLTEKCLALYQ